MLKQLLMRNVQGEVFFTEEILLRHHFGRLGIA
jgi:hypothetical protein